ncbi:MAG: hypothetical protein CMJ64_17965 [Planctomycetaceae bacterium]|nr:hypothetical protein [Planctomycetaceae bacterium]
MKMTQPELANRIGSSQSRVAKTEVADGSVSMELFVRSLAALGLRRSRDDSASIRRLSVYPGSLAIPAMLTRVMPFEAAVFA